MQARIDPLIAERAPWLYRDSALVRPVRGLLNWLLSYRQTIALGEEFAPLPWQEIMGRMSDRIARDVIVSGIDNIPAHGAALIVANHPTGIADGVIVYHLLRARRADVFFFANSDILRVLPQMAGMIAPVEWREEKRTHAKMRETMAYTRQAMAEGRLGVMFPSGRLARRQGLRLLERPWMASAASIARKFDVPVIPVHLQARNSALFYVFDLIHASLRDITLFHETMNKARQPYRVTIGAPVNPATLPAQAQDGIARLRKATLALGGRHAPAVSLVDATRRPGWV